MRRYYNTSRINPKRYYSFAEISDLKGCHIRTVQIWHSQGLPILDENRRPFLVLGADLISFIQKMKDSRRTKLSDDECYCVKCRAARKGTAESWEIVSTGKSLGHNAEQYIFKAFCETCGIQIQKFTSDKKLLEYRGDNPKFREQSERLWSNDGCSLNNDNLKENLK